MGFLQFVQQTGINLQMAKRIPKHTAWLQAYKAIQERGIGLAQYKERRWDDVRFYRNQGYSTDQWGQQRKTRMLNPPLAWQTRYFVI